MTREDLARFPLHRGFINVATILLQMMARYKFLKKVPLMSDIADSVIARIAGTLEDVEFEGGTQIIKEGTEGSTFYIIEQGSVRVTRFDESLNTNLELGLLDHGDFFGEVISPVNAGSALPRPH